MHVLIQDCCEEAGWKAAGRGGRRKIDDDEMMIN